MERALGIIAKVYMISIIIPVLNHAQALSRTLMALRKQTLKDFEIIIVDDGSSDHPAEIVKKFNDLPIHFMRWTENHGASAARNEGSRLSRGEFLLFLDADIVLHPFVLEKMTSLLAKNMNIDFVYGNFIWGNKIFKGVEFNVQTLKQKNYIPTTSLMRASAFVGFDENLKRFQDWDLWLSMCEKGSRGVWLNEIIFHAEASGPARISTWIPGFLHRIPWEKIGWMPERIQKYREAEKIIKEKHHLDSV